MVDEGMLVLNQRGLLVARVSQQMPLVRVGGLSEKKSAIAGSEIRGCNHFGCAFGWDDVLLAMSSVL